MNEEKFLVTLKKKSIKIRWDLLMNDLDELYKH